MTNLIAHLLDGKSLEAEESRGLFGQLISGELNDIEISAMLSALKVKGETPAEIAGAVLALRAAAAPFPRPDRPIGDCCGTGGDGSHTVNISTATAFLAAACGLKIAKHGNRSVSSKCGSADVLERLGYQLDRSAEQIAESIDGLGIGFLFAPNFHQAVRFAMPVRKTLASRTIFNLLGPLINPANPDYQLIGIYDPALIRPIAETLRLLGCKSALVVHGSGLDEIAIHGPTIACRLMDSEISEIRIDPSDFFRQRFSISDLTGGDPAENADSLKRCLTGSASDAYHFAVALNTAALLVLAEQVDTFSDGFELALDRLLSGAAAEKLAQFIKRTEDVSTDH